MKFNSLLPLTILSLFFFACDKDEPAVDKTTITFEAQTFETLETSTQGDRIGQVVASSNSAENITFRIIENSGDVFVMSSDGWIDVSTPLMPSYKTAPFHNLVVEATNGKETATATITINVIDVPDPFVTMWKTDNPGQSNADQLTITTVDGLTYDYTIDWGDGNQDANVTGPITHTYANAGTYTVSISGLFPGIYSSNLTDGDKLLSVEQWGDIEWTTMEQAFTHCENFTINATDAPDLSQVSSMHLMFAVATSLNADLSNWDVSNVSDMSYAFMKASSFNGNIGTWDVSNVSTMYYMFREASSFDQDLNNWDVSNVTTMNSTFYKAGQFDGDISNWDVSSVTDMNQMFREAGRFNGDISNWDVSSLTNMNFLFKDANTFNSDIGNWDVAQVTMMYNTFDDAGSFDQDLSNWNVSNVTAMNHMFRDSGLTTNHYNALLNQWSTLSLQSNVALGMGNIMFAPSAQTARDILINNYGWTITDGGMR